VEEILLLVSTPIFVLLIFAEMLVSHFGHKNLYSKKDTLINLLCTSLNFLNDIVFRGVTLFILIWANQFAFFTWEHTWIYWVLLFLAQDLAYYTLHCADHYSRFFWAAHSTHHSSEKFNFTVGIRSSVFQPYYRFIFYLPLAFFGFNALHIVFMYAACQVYGFWVHTELVNKMPRWFEYIFVTPSHHRVHHASNVKYLDSNMGMVLIVWDRIFGTFVAEDKNEPVKFGLTKNLRSYSPVKVVFSEWSQMNKDIKKGQNIYQKLGYVFAPPGWSHDGSSLTSKQMKENSIKSSTNFVLFGHKSGT
jgi:sterol desaturase/sphingolipid hydroxylase (fatty acid hydroxylase superfamily)